MELNSFFDKKLEFAMRTISSKECLSNSVAIALLALASLFSSLSIAQAIPMMVIKSESTKTTCDVQRVVNVTPPIDAEFCVIEGSFFVPDRFQLKLDKTMVINELDTAVFEGITGRYQNNNVTLKCEEISNPRADEFNKMSAAQMQAKVQATQKAMENFDLNELMKLTNNQASPEVIWLCAVSIERKQVLAAKVIFLNGR